MARVSPIRLVATILLLPPMIALVVAGSGKLLSLASFRHGLGSWSLLPIWSLDYVALMVPSAELLIGGAWMLGFARGVMERAAFWLLLLFTAAYLAHAVLLAPPTCDCFGQWVAYRTSVTDARVVVVRNVGLLACLVVGILLQRRLRRVARTGGITNIKTDSIPIAPTAQVTEPPLHSSSRAFTLIEVLIAIGIIAVVLSISVPLLVHSRSRAKEGRAHVLIAQHVASFNAYSMQYRDVWPYIADPAAPTQLITEDFTYTCAYFDTSTFWHLGLSRELYDVRWNDRMFQAENWSNGVWTYFWYSPTFIAAPEFWNASTRAGPAQGRATTASAVRYPSAKCLFVGPIIAKNAGTIGWQMGFTDGSAALVQIDDIVPGMPTGVGNFENGSEWLDFAHPGMVTVDGIYGRDRK